MNISRIAFRKGCIPVLVTISIAGALTVSTAVGIIEDIHLTLVLTISLVTTVLLPMCLIVVILAIRTQYPLLNTEGDVGIVIVVVRKGEVVTQKHQIHDHEFQLE